MQRARPSFGELTVELTASRAQSERASGHACHHSLAARLHHHPLSQWSHRATLDDNTQIGLSEEDPREGPSGALRRPLSRPGRVLSLPRRLVAPGAWNGASSLAGAIWCCLVVSQEAKEETTRRAQLMAGSGCSTQWQAGARRREADAATEGGTERTLELELSGREREKKHLQEMTASLLDETGTWGQEVQDEKSRAGGAEL